MEPYDLLAKKNMTTVKQAVAWVIGETGGGLFDRRRFLSVGGEGAFEP
ncbi:MAG TPA: hypothetical protein PLK28_14640 [Candidatus Rifleibacterium sp.]|nr:hypothetical protein [Candidatus Rifleibacterium sp.]